MISEITRHHRYLESCLVHKNLMTSVVRVSVGKTDKNNEKYVDLGICGFDILAIDIGKSEDKKSVISQYRYIKNGITEKVDRDNDYMLLKEW